MSLKDGNSTLGTRFMASVEKYNNADVIMVGVPMDYTSSFKPGSRFGPQKIREVSVGLEEYSLYLNRSISTTAFFDCGDLELPFGDVQGSLKIIEEAAEEILKDNKIPLFIGGEHLISVPAIKQVYKKYGNDLIVFHFDAHADLRDGYIGCNNSHASAIRRITDFMPGKNIFQFGVRSGTEEEFNFAMKNTNLYKYDVLRPLEEVIKIVDKRPVYITLDIDVVDPAYANGTGTPEPGGISSREIIQSITLLKGLNVIGADVVEVSPVYDLSDRTALLAAKIIRELLLIIK
ncbi:MAG: agmatinase [Firmicutes bacterium]|nr:agmatinase [Bacillota bacterium]